MAKAKDGAIRWRKTYVPGTDLHDHVQVRVETYGAAQNLVSDRLYAYLRDEQGTVLALADEASDPKKPSIPIRYLYTPYGNAHAETAPELRKGSYGFGITSVVDASGATKTQTAAGTLPGGVRLSFGIDVDLTTAAAGILFERRLTDGTWGALGAAEMAVGRAADAANSDVDILPLGGFAFATSYRVRTTAGLKDILGRSLADPKVLELPETPPVIAPGEIGASSFEYERSFPVAYDSAAAATNDANGLFPGGQPMGFQGQYTDPTLGFLITPNRAYDARNAVWLSQDPMDDRDSPNLYGFVGARPHEATDPLGLFELPEGPLTTSYNTAVSEALSPGNSAVTRATFGILGVLVAPAAGLEQAVHGFLATPERLNRNIPAVINETKAAIAATDTDARLRHGAAALGAGSSVVLDVTVIAGLAKSAATATVERELAQASVDAASAPVTNGAPVRAKPDYTNPQVVEAQVRQNAANALARAQRQGLRGAPGGNAADATFNRANAAFEKRLQDAGSPFGVEVQPARSAAGLPVPARTGGAYTAGSKRLDATIFDRGTGQVRNGFDITISTIKWNSTADNAAYTQRFGISQVEEINPNGPR